MVLNNKIWTARPRIGHVVIFQTSALRISNGLVAAGDLAAIALAAEAGLVEVIALAVEAGLAEVTASAAEDSVAAALADSVAAAAGSGADDENQGLELNL